MKMHVNLDNTLANEKSETIKSILAAGKDGFELSTLMELITLCEDKDIKLAYNVMVSILEDANVDAVLHRFSCFLTHHPYILSAIDEESYISKFKEVARKIASSGSCYNQNTLAEFVSALETLFAHGYHELRLEIYFLYQLLETPPFACDEAIRIQKKLAEVYQCNGRNYKKLLRMLEDTMKYCKRSKQKFLKRMVHYYHAVLCILSDRRDDNGHLDKACEQKFPLALILRDHTEINSETPKTRGKKRNCSDHRPFHELLDVRRVS